MKTGDLVTLKYAALLRLGPSLAGPRSTEVTLPETLCMVIGGCSADPQASQNNLLCVMTLDKKSEVGWVAREWVRKVE